MAQQNDDYNRSSEVYVILVRVSLSPASLTNSWNYANASVFHSCLILETEILRLQHRRCFYESHSTHTITKSALEACEFCTCYLHVQTPHYIYLESGGVEEEEEEERGARRTGAAL
jgi:hypothetical protein